MRQRGVKARIAAESETSADWHISCGAKSVYRTWYPEFLHEKDESPKTEATKLVREIAPGWHQAISDVSGSTRRALRRTHHQQAIDRLAFSESLEQLSPDRRPIDFRSDQPGVPGASEASTGIQCSLRS